MAAELYKPFVIRKLIEREALPGLGVRLSAVHPGTAQADARLEFSEPRDLAGDEWAVDCDGFTLYVDAGSVHWLDGAEIDYETRGTGGVRAREILNNWGAWRKKFVKVFPHEYRRALAEMAEQREAEKEAA